MENRIEDKSSRLTKLRAENTTISAGRNTTITKIMQDKQKIVDKATLKKNKDLLMEATKIHEAISQFTVENETLRIL